MAEDNYFRDYMHRTDDLMINKMDHYLPEFWIRAIFDFGSVGWSQGR